MANILPLFSKKTYKRRTKMRFIISTNDLKNDPEFKRLLGEYSVAKMKLVAYFNQIASEDISSTSVEEQLRNVKDGE